MKNTLIAGLAMLAFAVAMPAVSDPGALVGAWKGPWYIGMSSGIATLEISADGSGKIALTSSRSRWRSRLTTAGCSGLSQRVRMAPR